MYHPTYPDGAPMLVGDLVRSIHDPGKLRTDPPTPSSPTRIAAIEWNDLVGSPWITLKDWRAIAFYAHEIERVLPPELPADSAPGEFTEAYGK